MQQIYRLRFDFLMHHVDQMADVDDTKKEYVLREKKMGVYIREKIENQLRLAVCYLRCSTMSKENVNARIQSQLLNRYGLLGCDENIVVETVESRSRTRSENEVRKKPLFVFTPRFKTGRLLRSLPECVYYYERGYFPKRVTDLYDFVRNHHLEFVKTVYTISSWDEVEKIQRWLKFLWGDSFCHLLDIMTTRSITSDKKMEKLKQCRCALINAHRTEECRIAHWFLNEYFENMECLANDATYLTKLVKLVNVHFVDNAVEENRRTFSKVRSLLLSYVGIISKMMIRHRYNTFKNAKNHREDFATNAMRFFLENEKKHAQSSYSFSSSYRDRTNEDAATYDSLFDLNPFALNYLTRLYCVDMSPDATTNDARHFKNATHESIRTLFFEHLKDVYRLFFKSSYLGTNNTDRRFEFFENFKLLLKFKNEDTVNSGDTMPNYESFFMDSYAVMKGVCLHVHYFKKTDVQSSIVHEVLPNHRHPDVSTPLDVLYYGPTFKKERYTLLKRYDLDARYEKGSYKESKKSLDIACEPRAKYEKDVDRDSLIHRLKLLKIMNAIITRDSNLGAGLNLFVDRFLSQNRAMLKKDRAVVRYTNNNRVERNGSDGVDRRSTTFDSFSKFEKTKERIRDHQTCIELRVERFLSIHRNIFVHIMGKSDRSKESRSDERFFFDISSKKKDNNTNNAIEKSSKNSINHFIFNVFGILDYAKLSVANNHSNVLDSKNERLVVSTNLASASKIIHNKCSHVVRRIRTCSDFFKLSVVGDANKSKQRGTIEKFDVVKRSGVVCKTFRMVQKNKDAFDLDCHSRYLDSVIIKYQKSNVVDYSERVCAFDDRPRSGFGKSLRYNPYFGYFYDDWLAFGEYNIDAGVRVFAPKARLDFCFSKYNVFTSLFDVGSLFEVRSEDGSAVISSPSMQKTFSLFLIKNYDMTRISTVDGSVFFMRVTSERDGFKTSLNASNIMKKSVSIKNKILGGDSNDFFEENAFEKHIRIAYEDPLRFVKKRLFYRERVDTLKKCLDLFLMKKQRSPTVVISSKRIENESSSTRFITVKNDRDYSDESDEYNRNDVSIYSSEEYSEENEEFEVHHREWDRRNFTKQLFSKLKYANADNFKEHERTLTKYANTIQKEYDNMVVNAKNCFERFTALEYEYLFSKSHRENKPKNENVSSKAKKTDSDGFFDIESFYKETCDIDNDDGGDNNGFANYKLLKIQSQTNIEPRAPKMMIKKPIGYYTLVFMTPLDDEKGMIYGINRSLIDFLKILNEDFTNFSKTETNETLLSDYFNALYSFCRFFSEQTNLIHVDMDIDSYATWATLPILNGKKRTSLGVNMDSGVELNLRNRIEKSKYRVGFKDHLNSLISMNDDDDDDGDDCGFKNNSESDRFSNFEKKQKNECDEFDDATLKTDQKSGFFGNIASYVWYGGHDYAEHTKSSRECKEPLENTTNRQKFVKNVDYCDTSNHNLRKSKTETDDAVHRSHFTTKHAVYDRIHTFDGFFTVIHVPDHKIILEMLQKSAYPEYYEEGSNEHNLTTVEINLVSSLFKHLQDALYDFYSSLHEP